MRSFSRDGACSALSVSGLSTGALTVSGFGAGAGTAAAAAGGGVVPLPLSAITCEPAAVLSAIVSVALRAPAVPGAKETPMVQLLPDGMAPAHVLDAMA